MQAYSYSFTSLQSVSNIYDCPFREIQNLTCKTVKNSYPVRTQNVFNDENSADCLLNNNENFINSILANGSTSKTISSLRKITICLNDCCQNTFNEVLACKDVLNSAISTICNKSKCKKDRKYRITGSM